MNIEQVPRCTTSE